MTRSKPSTEGRARRAVRRGACLLALAALALAGPRPLAAQLPFIAHLRAPQVTVQPVNGFQPYLAAGKLRLHLSDFLRLALRNSPGIQLMQLSVRSASDTVISARAPFDPVLGAGFNAVRAQSPQSQQISGAATLNTLAQNTNVGYSETLWTGQSFNVSFDTVRNSTNSAFATFNPSILGGLNFSVTQPLLRNRGNVLLKTPLLVARSQLLVTTEQNQAAVADVLVTDANRYWDAVQARDRVRVAQQALALANKSYQRDQHALELGALPKLDIYQSQAQVARSQVQLVQARYAYREALDGLRQIIGADLDPTLRNTDIVLEDDAATRRPEEEGGASASAAATIAATQGAVDNELPAGTNKEIQDALARRPELLEAAARLRQDRLLARSAHELFKPKLDLGLQYDANGLGGNQLALSNALGSSTAGTRGGLSNALHQIFAFSAPTYGFSLQFSTPARNSAAEAQLADALVAQARDAYQQRQLRQQVIEDVRLSQNNLAQAIAQADAARLTRDLSEKNVAAEQQKYELGSTTIFEVLQAQVQLSQDENSLLAANIDYQKALIAAERANWHLFDRLGIQVNQLAH